MDPLRPSGRTRSREPSPQPDAPARQVRPRTAGQEGPALSSPTAGLPGRTPRTAGTQQTLAPRAGVPLPAPGAGSPRPVQAPHPDAGPAHPAQRQDSAAPPREVGNTLLPVHAVQGESHIHDSPAPDQGSWLMDMLDADPEQAFRALRAATDLLAQFGSEPGRIEGLEPRYQGAEPAVAAAARQLRAHLIQLESGEAAPATVAEWDAAAELSLDMVHQEEPLGREMSRWTGGAHDPAELGSRFDDEPAAPAFARLLARLREATAAGSSSAAATERAAQVASVIDAISQSTELREQVFLIAQTALGSCNDNVLEGFSKVLLAVRDHQMVDGIRSGRLDAAQFHRWAGQQLRLALLESEVTRFIQRQLRRLDLGDGLRKRLVEEPLETLVHAKQALRERLDLPEGTVSGMQSLELSVLQQDQLDTLEQAVNRQARDPVARRDFLMGHSTWRAGMQALHPEAFREYLLARNADPIFVEDIPEDLAGQIDYSLRARARESHWRQEEDRVLRQLAGFDNPRGESASPEPPGA
ncbi:NEL-type E3 ubiquitin ligase domain-containing protein [Paracidovorax avenae]|uniref:NEL-type E3 ubiquitin ligase domain-containing protein n=1 Tax=Paracidovorax avenae TaxID=80867 RepID=UPI001AD838EB|nr:NEL-type E3 ubiquitin ligase domain-containing protein [Paracidovorax avenae]